LVRDSLMDRESGTGARPLASLPARAPMGYLTPHDLSTVGTLKIVPEDFIVE